MVPMVPMVPQNPPPAYDPNSQMDPQPQGTPGVNPSAPDMQNQGAAGGAEESFEERLRRLKDM